MLPTSFCWTRYGTEAGENITSILARKERERSSNGGVFLWGIGNALGPSMLALLKETRSPKAIFSPILSAPRIEDIKPDSITSWTAGEGLHGEHYSFPPHTVVTSRSSTRSHYALVCYSEGPIILGDHGTVYFGSLKNLLSGNRIGSQQITAVVKQDGKQGTAYPARLVVDLHAPYFVRLT